MPWNLPGPPQPITPSGGQASETSGGPLAPPAPIPGATQTFTSEAPDPYGTDLATASGGDLVVTAGGDLGSVSGPLNCAQAVYMRLQTTRKDLPLHPEYGSLMALMVGRKMSPMSLVAAMNADLQSLLSDDARFTDAQVVQVRQPANTGQPDSVQLGVQATLFGGEQVTLTDASDPAQVDVTFPVPADPSLDPTLTWDPMTQTEFFAASEAALAQFQEINSLQTIVGS